MFLWHILYKALSYLNIFMLKQGTEPVCIALYPFALTENTWNPFFACFTYQEIYNLWIFWPNFSAFIDWLTSWCDTYLLKKNYGSRCHVMWHTRRDVNSTNEGQRFGHNIRSDINKRSKQCQIISHSKRREYQSIHCNMAKFIWRVLPEAVSEYDGSGLVCEC